MFKVFISNNPENLAAVGPTHTVEAEYGTTVVQGSKLTAAHHGGYQGLPAPAMLPNMQVDNSDVIIGLSHVDLDSVCGCMAIRGLKDCGCLVIDGEEVSGCGDFYKAVELADISGPHRLEEGIEKRRIECYYAWSDSNRIYAPRDGSAKDITWQLYDHMNIVNLILEAAEPEMVVPEVEEWRKKRLERMKSTLSNEIRFNVGRFTAGIALRRTTLSSGFVNADYRSQDDAILTYNLDNGVYTLSFADGPEAPWDAVEFMQNEFGKHAGGKRGIAGSPRGERMEDELEEMGERLANFMGRKKKYILVGHVHGLDAYMRMKLWAEQYMKMKDGAVIMPHVKEYVGEIAWSYDRARLEHLADDIPEIIDHKIREG